ncbi:F-box/kelch-repeat protein [Carex littledalei]|uniref:F-box/kelch-repeat protein n=1 Tax=Carex littledalei TaxID=544730 RepID=A0A833VJD8_9POAL|nr:F-box/kelch-repeat protein [Carex littledalei]
MDEQNNAYPNFQDYHVLLISPAVISSSKKAVSKNNEEVNKDSENGWSFLPTDLLNLIMTRLSSMADFSTFRAVCPTWRSLASLCPENLAYQSPLLLLTSPKKDIFGLYDFTRKRLYNMRLSIRTQQEPEKPYCIDYWTCLSYSHGFLVIANMPGFTEIMLYNIFTGNRIMLPAVKQIEGNLQFIFSSSPASPGCLVVMFTRGSCSFHFCCIGDVEWKCHCFYRLQLIDDMIFYYGKLYLLVSLNQFISIDFGCCLEQIRVEKEKWLSRTLLNEHSMRLESRLAQSCSELLLIQQRKAYLYDYIKLKCPNRLISIYRWDFSAGAWTEVSSLGGRALFFTDSFTASVPPTCFGVQANSIYYYSAGYYPETGKKKPIIWSEISLEDGHGTIRTVYHEPPSKELSSAVTWILPSMS